MKQGQRDETSVQPKRYYFFYEFNSRCFLNVLFNFTMYFGKIEWLRCFTKLFHDCGCVDGLNRRTWKRRGLWIWSDASVEISQRRVYGRFQENQAWRTKYHVNLWVVRQLLHWILKCFVQRFRFSENMINIYCTHVLSRDKRWHHKHIEEDKNNISKCVLGVPE